VAEGLQSEERYAQSYAAARVERGFGPLRIRAELRERGIDDALVDASLAEVGVDWQEQAREQRRKRFGDASPSARTERARQGRFLEGRGFPASVIARVLEF
jgi:regulatory protein